MMLSGQKKKIIFLIVAVLSAAIASAGFIFYAKLFRSQPAQQSATPDLEEGKFILSEEAKKNLTVPASAASPSPLPQDAVEKLIVPKGAAAPTPLPAEVIKNLTVPK